MQFEMYDVFCRVTSHFSFFDPNIYININNHPQTIFEYCVLSILTNEIFSIEY